MILHFETDEKQRDFFLDLIRNSQNLLVESKILFEHQGYRRAFFLLITAYEEIQSLQIMVESKVKIVKHKIKHSTRFSMFNEVLTDVYNHLEVDLEIALKDEPIKLQVAKSTIQKLKKDFDFTTVRNRLLYQDGSHNSDLNEHYYAYILHEESIKKYYPLIRDRVQAALDPLLPLILNA